MGVVSPTKLGYPLCSNFPPLHFLFILSDISWQCIAYYFTSQNTMTLLLQFPSPNTPNYVDEFTLIRLDEFFLNYAIQTCSRILIHLSWAVSAVSVMPNIIKKIMSAYKNSLMVNSKHFHIHISNKKNKIIIIIN